MDDNELIGYAIEVTISELERQISNIEDRLAGLRPPHVLYERWDMQRATKIIHLRRYRELLDKMYPEV